MCLYPDDQCERTSVAGEIALSSSINKNTPAEAAFAPILAIYAIIIANPFQFFFEIACMFLFKYKANKDSAKQQCFLLTYQVLMVLFLTYLLAHTTFII